MKTYKGESSSKMLDGLHGQGRLGREKLKKKKGKKQNKNKKQLVKTCSH